MATSYSYLSNQAKVMLFSFSISLIWFSIPKTKSCKAMFCKSKWIVFLLVLTSAFSRESSVFGSSIRERRFKRPDPLNHFRYYRGGYEVANKHYWASAAFTGIHGYAIAGVLILCGLAYGSYMILKHFISSSSSIVDYSNSSFLIMLFLILLFSLLAIVATGLAIAANQSCLHETRRLKNTVLGVATEARITIRNVTQAMDRMQSLLLPYDSKTTLLLNVTSIRLDGESRIIRNFVRRYERTINKAIQFTYVVNLVVVTVNLALLVAGVGEVLVLFVICVFLLKCYIQSHFGPQLKPKLDFLLLLHWRPGFLVITFLFWIFTILCWVLTGLDFFVHTFAKDTCSALEDFEQNSQNNTLSSLLPCVNSSYSDKVLAEIGYTVHTSIVELNSKVSEFSRLILPNEGHDKPNYAFSTICSPFSGAPNYSYAPENCPKKAMQIGDLPSVLSKFTCYQAHEADCARDGRFIPETAYTMAWAYCNAIDDLINIFPDMKSLLECSFVKDSVSGIVLHQCKPYKASNRKLWLSVLCLSIFMVVLVLLLVAKSFQDRGIISLFPITEYRQR